MWVDLHSFTGGWKVDLSSCRGWYWWGKALNSTRHSLDCLGGIQFAGTLSGIYHTLSLEGVGGVGGESKTWNLFLWCISLIRAFWLKLSFCLLILGLVGDRHCSEVGWEGDDNSEDDCGKSFSEGSDGSCYDSLLFFSLRTYLSFFCDYSFLPWHWPADYTCVCNHFLSSDSLDFYDSFLLTHMYFFMIPSHSTRFHLFHHCSGTFWVLGI